MQQAAGRRNQQAPRPLSSPFAAGRTQPEGTQLGTILTKGIESAFNDTYFQPDNIIPNALVLTQTTVAQRIEGDTPSLNVPYVSTAPAAQIIAEGDEIPEGGGQLSQMAIHTQKVAVLTAITNEAALSDDVKSLISQGMARAVTDKADAVFLQAPAPSDGKVGVTGLFNYPGIPTVGTIVVSGANRTGLDAIIDAIASISSSNGTPSAIIMGYGTWAGLLKMRLGDGTPQISPDVSNTPTPSLFGIPVVLNAQAPNGKIAVIDQREIIAAVGQITAAATSDRYFERDTSAMRSTFRFGFGIIHPDRCAIVTVESGEPGKTLEQVTIEQAPTRKTTRTK